MSATGGLRYTREEKTIDNASGLGPLSDATTVPSAAYTDRISYAAWTPKFGAELRIREQIFAYGSAARGFKSGGFNLTSAAPGRGFAPEWAWSYEGGLKIATDRSRLNLAAFQMNYTDLQVQTAIAPGVIDISNAAEATIRGVEVDGSMRLGLVEVGGHLSWLNARYDDYIAVGVGGVTGNVSGNRLTNAPPRSGRVWAQWAHHVGRGHTFGILADSNWQTTVFFTPFNDAIQRQPSFGLLNLSASFGPARRHWLVSAFARNLTNTDYITGSFSTPPPAIGGRPGDSRQVGVKFEVRR
jgi:iron complex outermembrane receptor protein